MGDYSIKVKLHFATDIKEIMTNAIYHEKADSLTIFWSWKNQIDVVKENSRMILGKGPTKKPWDT